MKNKELCSLVKRLKNKDNNAFEELYNQLWDTVYYLSYRYVNDKDVAKDITQETFIIIYEKIDTLKEEMAFNGWIHRIIYNLSCDYHRKVTKQSYTDIEDIEENFAEESIDFLPEELLHDKYKQDILLEEIGKLPLKLKSVVLLYYFEEMTLVDIGNALGVGKSAVHKRLIKAQKTLRSCIDIEVVMNQGAIIGAIFKRDSESICTNILKKGIHDNVHTLWQAKGMVISSSTSSMGLLTKMALVTFVGMGAGYAYVVSNDTTSTKETSVPEEVVVMEETEITVETFVGEDNAQLLSGWRYKSMENKDTMLLSIIEECQLVMVYYYLSPTTQEMYVLYKKQWQDKTMLLAEKYHAETGVWNIAYQIIGSHEEIIKETAIEAWFTSLEP